MYLHVHVCTCAQNVCYVIYGMLDVIIVEEIQHVSKLCDKNIKKIADPKCMLNQVAPSSTYMQIFLHKKKKYVSIHHL